MVISAYNPDHRHLVPINIKSGILLKDVESMDTEKQIVNVILPLTNRTVKKIEEYLLLQFGKYKLLKYKSSDMYISLTINCENVGFITKDDDPYDFIQCPDYMDFEFFKEKVIPAMKVARGLGKPIPIEHFYKYCKYPKYNFRLEKGY